MKKVIVFNGPPNCGKDVAAKYLTEKLNDRGYKTHHKEVKENLFKATKACFGVPDGVWDSFCTRENKEKPNQWLVNGGIPISPRQALINTSEEVLKPLFGKDVFGIMAANSLEDGINIFSDGGFKEEIECLREAVGYDNFLLVHVYREGCTFEGDSRDYVYTDSQLMVIRNKGTEQDYLRDVFNRIYEALE